MRVVSARATGLRGIGAGGRLLRGSRTTGRGEHGRAEQQGVRDPVTGRAE